MDSGPDTAATRVADGAFPSRGCVGAAWRLADGALIESVLIPASPALYGEPSDRHTLCVSTQVGCAYGCKFCASGLDGWKRHLRVEEIVNQVLAVERLEGAGGRMINNLVIMGMGEPLANYDNLLPALRILNAPWGAKLGARKITVSTSGLAPQIRRLADEPQQFRLAVSLHGATDETRARIMPINKKYPLKVLMEACRAYPLRSWEHLTFEYVMLGGVNDAADDARRVVRLLAPLKSVKMNLIPWNPGELPYKESSEKKIEEFRRILTDRGVPTFVRYSRGRDVMAACGQLALIEVKNSPLAVKG